MNRSKFCISSDGWQFQTVNVAEIGNKNIPHTALLTEPKENHIHKLLLLVLRVDFNPKSLNNKPVKFDLAFMFGLPEFKAN